MTEQNKLQVAGLLRVGNLSFDIHVEGKGETKAICGVCGGGGGACGGPQCFVECGVWSVE